MPDDGYGAASPTEPLTLREVVAALERRYPLDTAMGWDRVGLVAGDLDQTVRRVHFAVDPTLEVVAEAVAAGADLLVSHHPLLLRGVHSVATTSAKGEILTRAIVARPGIYVGPHQRRRSHAWGVRRARRRARPGRRSGRWSPSRSQPGGSGRLPEPVRCRDFATRIAEALPPSAGGVRVAGDPEATVQRVAVLGGSGDDRFEEVRSAGADVYVTADLRHHPVLEEREDDPGRGALPRRRRSLGHRVGVARVGRPADARGPAGRDGIGPCRPAERLV